MKSRLTSNPTADAKRNVVKIVLTLKEEQIMNECIAEIGMSKQEFVRRLFAWFASRDELVQKIMLGIAPKGQGIQASIASVVRGIADEIDAKREPMMVIRK